MSVFEGMQIIRRIHASGDVCVRDDALYAENTHFGIQSATRRRESEKRAERNSRVVRKDQAMLKTMICVFRE